MVCGIAGAMAVYALMWAAGPSSATAFAGCMIAGLLAFFGIRWVMARNRNRAATRDAAAVPLSGTDWPWARDALRISLLRRRVPRWSHTLAIMLTVSWSAFLVRGPTLGVGTAFALAPFTLVAAIGTWLVVRGGVQVRFDRFPYVVGEPVKLSLATTPGSAALTRTTVRLRLRRVLRADAPLPPRLLDWEYWSDSRRLDPVHQPGPDEFVEVTFDPPADLPGTRLHDTPPLRWEVVVIGTSRWGELEETFPVPVYEPSSRSTPAGDA